MKINITNIAFILGSALVITGCQSPPKSVVAATGTNIGLEFAQNPATQAPEMRLGYNRAEVAIVSENEYDGDVANVLMELRYGGSDSTHPGIYQRLAVGKTAVQQDGASAMFLKNADGTIPTVESVEAAKAGLDTFNTNNLN